MDRPGSESRSTLIFFSRFWAKYALLSITSYHGENTWNCSACYRSIRGDDLLSLKTTYPQLYPGLPYVPHWSLKLGKRPYYYCGNIYEINWGILKSVTDSGGGGGFGVARQRAVCLPAKNMGGNTSNLSLMMRLVNPSFKTMVVVGGEGRTKRRKCMYLLRTTSSTFGLTYS